MLQDRYRFDPARYLVVTDRLAIYSGVYTRGEVLTEFQVGSAGAKLISQGVLQVSDYDLKALKTGPEVF